MTWLEVTVCAHASLLPTVFTRHKAHSYRLLRQASDVAQCYRYGSTNCPSSRCRKLKLRRWPNLATRKRVRFWPSSWSSWGSRRLARTPSAPKWPPWGRRPNSWTPKWRWLVPWPAAPRWDPRYTKRPQTVQSNWDAEGSVSAGAKQVLLGFKTIEWIEFM